MVTRERRAREIQESIRRVLLDFWDPLRVSGEPSARDEYDSCIAGCIAFWHRARHRSGLLNISGRSPTSGSDRCGIMGISKRDRARTRC